MKRPGTLLLLLLLLLLTSAAAVQYRWQTDVSLPGPAVQTTSAASMVTCGLTCERRPPEECSGFIYDAGDGTCRLFSGDCRGPAASSSQQTTDRYMARNNCPGNSSNRCSCPAGFSRCAGRCLAGLDQSVAYTEAVTLCAELGAHLAVPRSQAENQCAMAAAAGPLSWLGFDDAITEGQWRGVDGCGGVVTSDDPRWAAGEPKERVGVEDLDYMLLVSDNSTKHPQGWHNTFWQETGLPLCQLPFCHLVGCQ